MMCSIYDICYARLCKTNAIYAIGTCSNISFIHQFFHILYDYTIKGVIDEK